MKFLDENRLLSDLQFGFRPKMSTELAATLFLDKVRKNFNQGYMVGATFIDLSKAFDTISHSRLVAKLHGYGLNGTELERFTSYLLNRNAQVSYNGSISSPEKIGDGVSQGSIVGPLLFILYFNDVVYTTENVSIINYADGTVIYTTSKEVKEINAKLSKTLAELRGEWPSGPASSISFTEVKHGCVRSETGWATFQMNDQKAAHSAVLRKGR